MSRMRAVALSVCGAVAAAGLVGGCAVDSVQKDVLSVTFTQTGRAKTAEAQIAAQEGRITVPAGRPGTFVFTLELPVKHVVGFKCLQSWIEEKTYEAGVINPQEDSLALTYRLPAGLRAGTSTVRIACTAWDSDRPDGIRMNYVIRVTAAPTTLYWGDTGGISRASLAGSGKDIDFTAQGREPSSIAVSDTHIYYAQSNSGAIGRARLDGSDDQPAFIQDANTWSVAIDGRNLYWLDFRGKIQRSNLSGGNREVVADTGSFCVLSRMAVDDGYVFYTTPCASGQRSISRVKVTGGSPSKIVTPQAVAYALAADNGYLYWGQVGGGIGRARSDGTDPLSLILPTSGTVDDVALSNEYLYWGQLGSNAIGRARLDGTDAQPGWLNAGSRLGGLATGPGAAKGGSGFSAAPDPADFGKVRVGTASTLSVVVTNTGDTPLDFVHGSVMVDPANEFGVVQQTCTSSIGVTLPPGGTCVVEVGFSPGSAGLKSGTLTMTGVGGKVHTVQLIGAGITSSFRVSPDPLAFPDQAVGTTSAPRTVTITQTAETGTIDSLTLAGGNGQFTLDDNQCTGKTLTNGQTCTAVVRFTPTSAGAQAAGLVVSSGGEAAHAVVTGNGTVPVPEFDADPATIDFGDQPVTVTWNPQTVTIRNTGTLPMTIGTVGLTGADADSFFVVTQDCGGKTLAPATGSCTAQVIFLPTAGRLGKYGAGLTFDDNAPGHPHTVPVTGNSVDPAPPS